MPMNLYGAYQTVKRHLYNSENWTDTQVDVFNALYGANIMGIEPWKGVVDYIYDSRNGDAYRDRYGIEGGGYDPRRAPDSQATAGLTRSLNFVSRNIDGLYKDERKKTREYRRSMRWQGFWI